MSSSNSLLTLLLSSCCLLMASACAQDPFSVTSSSNLDDGQVSHETGPTPRDGLDTPDGDGPDGGGDADACVPTNEGVELCDDLDNDCNGEVDDVDPLLLKNDAAHCGECGKACIFPNAFAKCVDAKCEMTDCAVGFYDIQNGSADGCEYRCQPSNGGAEICDEADNNCDGVIDDGFDKNSSLEHCGGCNKPCARTNATAICSGGVCTLGPCNAGFSSINQNDDDGCEYQCPAGSSSTDEAAENIRCDGVDNDCDGAVDEDFPANIPCGNTTAPCTAGVAACVNGIERCEGGVKPLPESCDNIDNDCNGTVDDGFDKLRDPRYCGDCTPCALPHAINRCNNGTCEVAVCELGYVDLITDDASDATTLGCETACTPTGNEICDGIDNNCDGQIDEGLLGPANTLDICSSVGECGVGTPAVASCQLIGPPDAEHPDGPRAWVCSYGPTVNARSCTSDNDCLNVPCYNNTCPGELPDDEVTCDGFDNDCDGQVDETFTTKGDACYETGTFGACRDSGTYVCSSDGTTVECDLSVQGATPEHEICDGLDNDCDGRVDEHEDDNGFNGVRDATARITVSNYDADGPGGNPAANYDYFIYAYEASRPGATGTSQGNITTRACSTANVLPWTSVSFTDAEAACQAIDPNCTSDGRPCWRLCSATEWYLACASASEQTYPYGNSYGASTCNGQDNDGDAGTSGDQDVLLPTGNKASCVRSGVFDLSGNAREWTNDPRTDGIPDNSVDGYTTRGGGYDTPYTGLTCGFNSAIFPDTFVFPNLGFRCCRDAN